MTNIDLRNFTISQGITIYGTINGDNSGWSVSGAGDVNGDNIDDVIISAPDANPFGRTNAGESYLIFGRTTWQNIDLASLSTYGIRIYGAANGDKTGISISAAGDVNGDGYADFLIGAYLADPLGRSDAGESYLIFGKNTGWTDIDLSTLTLPQGITIYGAVSGDNSGYSVSGAGDVNSDGYSDIIIGAYRANPFGRLVVGESYIIFGKNTTWTNIDLNTTLSFPQGIKIYGAADGGSSGYSVSSAGDVNGDGYSDIIIGAPITDPFGRMDAGSSYLIFGKTTWQDIDLAAFTVLQGITICGAADGDNSGISVSGAGDINSDGYSDIIIGAYRANPFGRTNAGASYVIFGKNTGWTDIDLNTLTLPQGITIYGAVSGDNSGLSVSSAGDVNGNGHSDIIIGANFADPFGRTGAGKSYIIFGKNTTWTNIDLNTTLSFPQGITILGATDDDNSGFSVSSAGDVDGNGRSDIIIGANLADPFGRADAGNSYIIFDSILPYIITDNVANCFTNKISNEESHYITNRFTHSTSYNESNYITFEFTNNFTYNEPNCKSNRYSNRVSYDFNKISNNANKIFNRRSTLV